MSKMDEIQDVFTSPAVNSGEPHVNAVITAPQTPLHAQPQPQPQHIVHSIQPHVASPVYPGPIQTVGLHPYSGAYSPFGHAVILAQTPVPSPTPSPISRQQTPMVEQPKDASNGEGPRRSPRKSVTVATKRTRAAVANPTAAKRGRGAKSGMNARNIGASEDEMSALPEEIKSVSGIKPVGPGRSSTFELKDGIAILQYILAPEQWPNFLIHQREIFTTICQTIVSGKTYSQVSGWYGRQWQLYCAVRAMQEHTGGGDGDDFKITTLEGEEGVDIVMEEGDKKINEVKNEEVKPLSKNGWKGITGRYSRAQLEKFAQSKYFAMFDEVAHDHPNVKKTYDISSDKTVEIKEDTNSNDRKRKRGDEPSSTVEELLASTVDSLNEHQKKQLEHQERSFGHQIALLEIEQNRFKRETEEADMRKVSYQEDVLAKKWAAYYESMKFTDEVSAMRTEKLKRELRELEGF